MRILGIESSCDETAAAVVEDGQRLLSNVVQSQIDIHKAFGGVVPEVAARSHIEVVLAVVDEALKQAQCTWEDIDAIAVTYAPGLIGSLLIGALTARTLALTKQKPLYAIHHVKGHVYANFINTTSGSNQTTASSTRSAPAADSFTSLGREGLVDSAPVWSEPKFPMLALIVSGGHSQLVLFEGHESYRLLGQTQDDAVGEAFDKVAKIIGLPYPGGPSIAAAAEAGDPQAFSFPKAKLSGRYDYSFSGLKTAVLRAAQAAAGVDHTFPSYELPAKLDEVTRRNIAASFQRVAIETLVDKAELAYKEYSPASVVIAGGVAANQELRRQLSERLPLPLSFPPMVLCTDNAAMIASLAYFEAQHRPADDPLTLEVVPSLSM